MPTSTFRIIMAVLPALGIILELAAAAWGHQIQWRFILFMAGAELYALSQLLNEHRPNEAGVLLLAALVCIAVSITLGFWRAEGWMPKP